MLFFFFRIIQVGGDFITFKYRYRKQILIGTIIIVLLLATSTIIFINYDKKEKETSNKIVLSKKENSKSPDSQTEDNLLKVDIKGEVVNPGIYSVTLESRVIDVIEKAGGLTQNANTTVINLSKKVIDEMVIIIYSNNQVKEFEKTKQIEQQVQTSCIQKDENSLKNDACITSTTTNSSKISINSATLEQLKALPGIGEEKAKDIIEYRTTNGNFKTLEDITKVSGIGASVFAKIKDYITL